MCISVCQSNASTVTLVSASHQIRALFNDNTKVAAQ